MPDPSFKNVDPVVGLQRIGGWFGGGRRNLSSWNLLFRTRRSEIPRKGSPFAAWVAGRLPEGARVVDLGCGTGRDTSWFAREGREVIGMDFSSPALRYTRNLLSRRGIASPDVRALPLNDLRGALLAGAELARLPEAPYLYARGLLGCLDADARANLWLLCSMALRRGGSLHVEYAASRPGLSSKQVEGLVRRLRTSELRREVEAAGGRVVHAEHGPGRDFFGRPDPHVARLEVRWDADRRREAEEGGAVFKTRLFKDEVEEIPSDETRSWRTKALSLPAVVKDLQSSVKENRRLNRRVAELTDVVAELLVPLADRDEEKARELLAKYRETTLAT